MPESTKKTRYTESVGRRKTSTARVRIMPSGTTGITVNEKKFHEYFVTEELRHVIQSALSKVDAKSFTFSVRVNGGGIHSQAEAIRHGIARALIDLDPEMRTKVKKLGFLKRDPRAKERRKFGLKKARKAPQWSKR